MSKNSDNKISRSKIKCYIDNNATTIMPKQVIEEIVKWTNMGNPSADYCTAVRCRKLIRSFQEYIAKIGQFKLSTGEENNNEITPEHYRIIFTSCASESNSLIIRSVVDSFHANAKSIPHIVSSQIEHKSIINLLEQLEKEGRATVTLVPPNALGYVSVIDVEKAITPDTALCSIMAANNETGVINNYAKIAKLCHAKNVPFHTDAVQIYGKYPIKPVKDNIDAFSVSFHKLHGPIGVGMLVIKEEFIRGYKLCGQIGGTQNGNFRGGTMNISGLAGAYEAMKITMANRIKKNEHMRNVKRHIIQEISARMPSSMYREYLKDKVSHTSKPAIEVVFISNAEQQFLPNTLLISIVKRTKPDMCNMELKKHMCDRGIIISIGSACNTDSDKASHVLKAMGVDQLIRKGTLRISLGDESSKEESDIFVKELLMYLKRINL